MKTKLIKYVVVPACGAALLLLLLATVGAAGVLVGNQSKNYVPAETSGLSKEVEAYRKTVKKYADNAGIGEYTDHLLCIMQTSTSGVGSDVMNAGEFSSNTKFPQKRGMITEPSYSIECGVQEFKELISSLSITAPNDSDKLLILYQAYHLNRGYIDYADGSYTPENAKAYCDSKQLGDYFNYNFAQQVAYYLSALNGTGSFKYPLKDFHTVSSPYGYRYSPITGIYELHSGTDFPAPQGTPVLASRAGIVERAENMGGYGNCVVIRHDSKYTTYYAHNVSLVVFPGQTVNQGDIIAYVGSTGNSTGPHCHFEIRENGKPVDSIPYLESTQGIK